MAILDPVSSDRPTVIGVSRPRIDSREKVRGETRYAADLPPAAHGLLHARLVLSLYAHARIGAIDTTAALQVPGVVAVLTAKDLPIVGVNRERMFHPLAHDDVVFAGQPVAIVVAESEAAAQDGVDAVEVSYEPLPIVVDPVGAMAVGADPARPDEVGGEGDGELESAHAAVGGAEDVLVEDLSANVSGRHWHHRGDVDADLAASAAVAEGRFTTSWVYQAYLETQGATAWIDPGDTLVVQTSTQGIFYTRSQLAKIFGLPIGRVRVMPAALGGGFGAKIMLIEPLAAGAALALRRPVRLVLTRREDFAMSNPAPGSTYELRVGADREGRLTGLRARIVFDAGAFSESSLDGIASVLVAGPYQWQSFDIRGYGVLTNRVGTGSYRGPGGPQSSFAIESMLDELAAKLGMDPIELRRRNVAHGGEEMVDGEHWERIGAPEVVDALADHPLWRRRGELPAGEGVGMGMGAWPGGRQPAAAVCRLEPDGTLSVITGVVDMSGVSTGFATIAAEVFGVDPATVNVVSGDTVTAPKSPMSGGSVITYAVGRAVQEAAKAARDKLLRFASESMEIAPADLEIVGGMVRPKGSPDQGLSVVDLAGRLDGFGVEFEPIEGHGGTPRPGRAPTVSGHLAHVRVDPETGQVDVLGYVIAQDVGRALNPALVDGQLRGGATQGIGWALYEGLQFDDQGQLLTGSFMDYAVPMAGDVPRIETILVEVPSPDGPFGAKGVGEAPVCGSPGAIANAIAAATGTRMRAMPMTAERVWAAMHPDAAGSERDRASTATD
jgi:CO/xanthine dehydrogenase Mo-binding subunit